MRDSIAESLAALTRFVVGDARFDETLQRVSELAREAVVPASMAGITMMVEDGVSAAFFTNSEVPEIDRAQYDVGEGPCLEAWRTKEQVMIESTLGEGRWPAFCRTAAEHGVLSTLSLSLVAGDASLGALNLYAIGPSAFAAEHAEDASAFATQAAVVLANTQAYWDAYVYGQGLAAAMETRGVIDQAKGVLMAQSGVDGEQAFEFLRRNFQRENRKLTDVATEIVHRVSKGPDSDQ
jgi:transcriptional regulator with GAF, ATPase, and Fis domain